MTDNRKLIAAMAQRADKCRRLAKGTNDDWAHNALVKMADEIEADIRGMEASDQAGKATS